MALLAVGANGSLFVLREQISPARSTFQDATNGSMCTVDENAKGPGFGLEWSSRDLDQDARLVQGVGGDVVQVLERESRSFHKPRQEPHRVEQQRGAGTSQDEPTGGVDVPFEIH